jgi:hypothetical protein
VCERYLQKQNEVFTVFMDLEKAYARVDRHAMGKMLKIYGVGCKILSAIKSACMYEDSRKAWSV